MPADPGLDLSADVVTLTAALVDIESVSHTEKEIADAVEHALSPLAHLAVERHGNTLVARTDLGRSERVVLAGHLDTVPINVNLPSRVSDGHVHGLGSADMKGGVAVALRAAATVPAPSRDVTYIFYECEEVEAEHNGLGRLAGTSPQALAADFAVLLEPTDAVIEAGCQGTMRIDVLVPGERAHSARSWRGVNAIHQSGAVLDRLRAYEPRQPEVDGLRYREGLNAVAITGGVAGNVLPDECRISVNYRFAPDRDEAEAEAHLREVFGGFEVTVADSSPGARPGLDQLPVAAFVEAIGAPVNPKYGWTDVSQFSALGVPAINFGPGDPMLAHTQAERVPLEQLERCEERICRWLS